MEKVRVLRKEIALKKLNTEQVFDESEYALLENVGFRTKITLMAIKQIFGGKVIK